MSTLIAVDEEGRMVLPKAIRESLHLQGKAVLAANLIDDRIELKPVSEQALPVRRKGRFLVIKATGQAFDSVSALAESRDER
jgi:AbrB family looped-hinge helix DNA binding protein